MSPGGEDTTLEEYIVAPAGELQGYQEAGKDYIKLYGPNEGVSMVAQPVTGQGSLSMISRSMLSAQGSFTSQGHSLKDPIVTLFGSIHDNLTEPGSSHGLKRVDSDSSLGDHHRDHAGDGESNAFGTSDSLSLHYPLLSGQGNAVKDKPDASKETLGLRSNSSLTQGNADEVASRTDIGGGWQLVYKSERGAEGKREELQRVYLHADAAAAAPSGSQRQRSSFVLTSGLEIPVEGDAFPAAALVSRSVLGTQDMLNLNKPEAAAKGPGLKALLEPGVKRALIVGVGLQSLQQVNLVDFVLLIY